MLTLKTKTNHIATATPYYALIQALYWAVYCLMVGFASAFLLDRGFSTGQIGTTLGLSYLLVNRGAVFCV